MKKAFNAVSKTLTVILILPFALILLYIAWELFGCAANSIAAEIQTNEAVKFAEKSGVEVIDSRSFAGNASGTGNHVDLLSAVVVLTDSPEKLENGCDFIYSTDGFEESVFSYSFHKNRLSFPENTKNCYIMVIYRSAPFSDNIMGH